MNESSLNVALHKHQHTYIMNVTDIISKQKASLRENYDRKKGAREREREKINSRKRCELSLSGEYTFFEFTFGVLPLLRPPPHCSLTLVDEVTVESPSFINFVGDWRGNIHIEHSKL